MTNLERLEIIKLEANSGCEESQAQLEELYNYYVTNNETEQSQMIRDLVRRIKQDLLVVGDFKDLQEMVEYTVNKAKETAYDADKWGYNEAKTIAKHIAIRVNKLKGINKRHKILTRIDQIINEVKY